MIAYFSVEWTQATLTDVIEVRSGKDYKHLGKGGIPVYGTEGYMLSADSALSNNEDAIGIGRKGTIPLCQDSCRLFGSQLSKVLATESFWKLLLCMKYSHNSYTFTVEVI